MMVVGTHRELRLATVIARQPLRVEELTPGESTIHAGLHGDHARRQWRLGRRALRTALSAIGPDADTSTIRFPHRRISLTYAGAEAVALAAVTDPPDLCGVGIDRELRGKWRPSRATARLFLHPAEIRWLETLGRGDQSPALLRLWTVKEALFKADPGNAGRQLSNYQLDDPSADRGSAAVAGDPTSFWYRTRGQAGPTIEALAVAERRRTPPPSSSRSATR